MKRKIANILQLLGIGALLASVVLGIIMLVNFYKWFNFEIGDYLIETEKILSLIQERNGYQAAALSMIEPVCYTLFASFVTTIVSTILKYEPKQMQVK